MAAEKMLRIAADERFVERGRPFRSRCRWRSMARASCAFGFAVVPMDGPCRLPATA
jgi:hypothetical protein